MVSLYGILSVGSRGVNVAQSGLNTTGHNIANVNTEGYSVQRNIQGAMNPIMTPAGPWDTGVDVIMIQRMRDNFLETQIRDSVSQQKFYDKMEKYFGHLESILNDPLTSVSDTEDLSNAGGLNNLISRFFRSMNELSSTPDSIELRTAAIESAVTLTETINIIESELYNFMLDLNQTVSLLVEEVDNLAEQLVSLNSRIALTEAQENVQANDFRDQRDVILKRLSEIMPIKTIENNAGIINVSVAGNWLVDQLSINPFVPELTRRFEEIDIQSIRLGKGGLYLLDDSLREGELGAAFKFRDRLLPDIMQDLADLSRALISEVNQLHSQSSGLEGYSKVNSNFFFSKGYDAADSKASLDRVFNNPVSTIDTIFGKNPFPMQDGSFQIRVADKNHKTRDIYTVNVDTSDNLYQMVEKINRADGIVNTATSALTFDPVFVERATARAGEQAAEAGLPLSQLAIMQGTPLAEAPASPPAAPTNFTFDILIKDASGQLVDSNPATAVFDPFTITFDNTHTLQDIKTIIQTAGVPNVFRAAVLPSASDPTVSVLQVQPVNDKWTLSFQNDNSGLVEAFDFPMTDPTVPLIGGTATRTDSTISDPTFYTGAGDPEFSPAFPGPPPSVIDSGTFEFVVVDNNHVPTVYTVPINNLVAGDVNTFAELETLLESFDPNISVTVTADTFTIESSNNREFFFQNDTTGLIKSLNLGAYNGFGSINGVPFQEGSFEVVVTNDNGIVTHIVEVPVTADPSVVGGVPTLTGIIDLINSATRSGGAPVQASIVRDPTNKNQNLIQINAETGYEFTFRSDDSLLLSALGFTSGPVLNPTGATPILGAEFSIAVGDQIGGMVRATQISNLGFEITTVGDDEITFVGEDTSNFLAAAGVNSFFTGYNARTLQVNKNIIDNVALLAISSDGTAGNNATAFKLASLEDKNAINGQSIGGFYRSMISSLGAEGSSAKQLNKTSQVILRELEATQNEKSSVSIDEESINLIKYQQAYQASAKIIQLVDELLDIVINRIGS
jgi:flagellar hook-associated protein FlgK